LLIFAKGIPPFEKWGLGGGFETVDFPKNFPQSPFIKEGSQSLNLMAVTLPRGNASKLVNAASNSGDNLADFQLFTWWNGYTLL
jgi:hypothetical protein